MGRASAYDLDMLVLNLSCSHGHSFEGWFSSHEDYQAQQARHLLSCPMCGDASITRMPSAPRLNISNLRDKSQELAREQVSSDSGRAADQAAISASAPLAPSSLTEGAGQKQWLELVAHVMSNTEDVGTQFAEEARRIHYGEAQERGIRGSASADDAAALLDEGIEVLPLPLPVARRGPVQ